MPAFYSGFMLEVVNIRTIELKNLNREVAGLHFTDQEDVPVRKLRAGGICLK